MLLEILIATFLVSLISFAGVIVLGLKERFLNKILLFLVALSAGALIGGAFLHLIPEVQNMNGVFLYVIGGFFLFFVVEKVLHWRHCHKKNCSVHSFAYMNLVGDFFHNFLDGLIIAASFLVDFKLGTVTTLAIAIHEIPQEIGDFGVLIYGGMKKRKAIFLNFLFALTAVLGGLTGYLLSFTSFNLNFIIPIAAGGFIYIAASDLIPEIRKDNTLLSIGHIIIFLAGIGLMWLLKGLGV